MTTSNRYIFKLSTHMGALLKELDKIDPVWYNSSMKSEYRNFDGNIYNTGGANNATLPNNRKQ
jgi:hypothetical protein